MFCDLYIDLDVIKFFCFIHVLDPDVDKNLNHVSLLHTLICLHFAHDTVVFRNHILLSHSLENNILHFKNPIKSMLFPILSEWTKVWQV